MVNDRLTRDQAIVGLPPAVAALVVAIGGAVLAITLPLAALPGALRLGAVAVLTTGAWLTVHRLGLPDLALGGTALAGAWVTAVLAEARAPTALLLVGAALAGAVVGGTALGVAGRVGRVLSAMTSLATTTALVALVRATELVGASGHHAIPLVTGDDRADLVVSSALLATVGLGFAHLRSSRTVRRAVVAARAPHVLAAEGRSPVLALLLVGALSGAVVGLGGALTVTSTGSLLPAAFGLPFTALVALSALLAGELQSAARLLRPVPDRAAPPRRARLPLGATPLGFAPLVAATLVVGPGILFPRAPFVASAPALLVAGPPALALLGWRRRERAAPRDPVEEVVAPRAAPGPRPLPRPAEPPLHGPAALVTSIRSGGPTAEEAAPFELRVQPGEIVGLVGPNGSGKSTVLARIGGQLPSPDPVRVGGIRVTGGPGSRAQVGLARTWQRPVDMAVADPGDGRPRQNPGVAWARRVLGEWADTPGGVQLQRVAAQRPSVVLLDEPGGNLPVPVAADWIRGMAAAGVSVLLVEHRDELLRECDRVVDLLLGEEIPGAVAASAARRSLSPGVDLLLGAPVTVASPVAPAAAGEGIFLETGDFGLHAPPGRVTVVEEPEADLVRAALAGRRRGAMTVEGRSPTSRRGATRARVGLWVMDRAPVADDLSIRDHLRAVTTRQRAEDLLANNPLLADRGDDPAGVLSGGERQILAWTMLRARRPRAVVLDHPTRGLDTGLQHWLGLDVRRLAGSGSAVLVLAGSRVEASWHGPGLRERPPSLNPDG